MEKVERTILIVKPENLDDGEEICARIMAQGLDVIGFQDIVIPRPIIESLYQEHKEKERDFFPWLCEQMCSGPVEVILIEGELAISRIRDLAGDTDPEVARINAPQCLRAKYSDSNETLELSRKESRGLRNVVHTPENAAAAKREGTLFFPAAFAD